MTYPQMTADYKAKCAKLEAAYERAKAVWTDRAAVETYYRTDRAKLDADYRAQLSEASLTAEPANI